MMKKHQEQISYEFLRLSVKIRVRSYLCLRDFGDFLYIYNGGCLSVKECLLNG